MTAPEQLLREFISAFEGDPSTDPREYLARIEGLDRQELETLIEAYLERAPGREWDASAFAGSLAERAVAAVPDAESAPSSRREGAEVGWPALLPELREKARLKRATVVERLAGAIGFADSADRVAVYYHRMEQGQLPPQGVSTKVLAALGSILGVSAARLREAGLAGGAGAGAGGEVFARLGAPSRGMASPGMPASANYQLADADRPEGPDELDLLFLGGD